MTNTLLHRLLLATALAAALIACGGDDDEPPTATPGIPTATVATTATAEQPTPAPTAAASATVLGLTPTPQPLLEAITATIEAGPGSYTLAAGTEAIWVTLSGDGRLARIDPATNEVAAIIEVGAAPHVGGDPDSPAMDVVVDGENVWLTASIGTSASDAVPAILRIDAVTNTVAETFTLSAHPRSIAFGAGSLWVTSSRTGAVLRVDPETGDTVATIPLNTAEFISVGAGAVWATSNSASAISRIDPETNTIVATIPLGGFITSLAASEDVLWASVLGPEGPSDLVVRIDPATNAVVATIPLAGAGDLELDGDDLWALSGAYAAIVHIDPNANQVTAMYRSGLEDWCCSDVQDGVIWVANPYTGTVTRIEP